MMPFNPRSLSKRISPATEAWPIRDVEMAELFGVYAGDGCLAVYRRGTTTDYRLTVSGSLDDFEYLEWVRSIYFEAFRFSWCVEGPSASGWELAGIDLPV
jgi:hypothetical protein